MKIITKIIMKIMKMKMMKIIMKIIYENLFNLHWFGVFRFWISNIEFGSCLTGVTRGFP